MFINICLFVCFNLNANEKVVIKENSNNNHVSFSKAFKDNPSFGLVEKMSKEGKEVNYEALSKGMFYLGIAGAVVAGVSLLLIIVGAVLYGVGWDIWLTKHGAEATDGLNMAYAGYALMGAFGFFLVVGIIMAAVGFVLKWYFGKKAQSVSMFVENRKDVVLADADIHYQNSPAIGIRFSF